MNVSPVKLWLGVLLLVIGLYGAYTGVKVYRRLTATTSPSEGLTVPAEPIGEQRIGRFQLTDRTEETFDSAELEGKVWIGSFFFADCPGACLKMNSTLAKLQSEMFPRGVKFVSITVNPSADTPKRLREYAAAYGASPDSWHFLTGDLEDIRRLAVDEFRVPFATSTHSERLILVDAQGKIRGTYQSTQPAQIELLRRKVKDLLAEAGQPDDASSESSPADSEQPAEPSPDTEASANSTDESTDAPATPLKSGDSGEVSTATVEGAMP